MAPSNHQEHSGKGGVVEENGQFGKHRTVIAIDEERDISQEPETKDLHEVFKHMTQEERIKTIAYIRERRSSADSIPQIVHGNADIHLHKFPIMMTPPGTPGSCLIGVPLFTSQSSCMRKQKRVCIFPTPRKRTMLAPEKITKKT